MFARYSYNNPADRPFYVITQFVSYSVESIDRVSQKRSEIGLRVNSIAYADREILYEPKPNAWDSDDPDFIFPAVRFPQLIIEASNDAGGSFHLTIPKFAGGLFNENYDVGYYFSKIEMKNSKFESLHGFERSYCPVADNFSKRAYWYDDVTRKVTHSVEVKSHPLALTYLDFTDPRDGIQRIPRTSDHRGSCASNSFPSLGSTEGIDILLRQKKEDGTAYVESMVDLESLFPNQGFEYFDVENAPLALSESSVIHTPFKEASQSLLKGVSLYTEDGRHMIRYHVSVSMNRVSECQISSENGEARSALFVDEASNTEVTTYHFTPTWIALLPQRPSGRRGGMVVKSRNVELSVHKQSKAVQIVDSGRRLAVDVVRYNLLFLSVDQSNNE